MHVRWCILVVCLFLFCLHCKRNLRCWSHLDTKSSIRQTVEINMSILTRGGHWGLWYCSIELFFMQYCGILNLNMRYCSLLRSRFLGCHATLPPKKRLLTSEPHSFPFVFVVCLCSVEQTNHIIAKCEWHKLSRGKVCSANTWGISGFCFTLHVAKNRRCSQVTIMTDEKIVNESPKYKCFMCSSLCSANERIYIFGKCQIVSVNQGRNASYRFKSGGKRTKSGIQNLLSTNRAKLLDFLIPLLN